MSDLRPIRDDVRRLGRVPEVDSQVLEARRVWREAVGEQVAANSLPVRRSGDALIVHCASSGWASELTLLERQMRSRLEMLMDPPPARLRFEVGDVDVPETVAPAGEPAARDRAQRRSASTGAGAGGGHQRPRSAAGRGAGDRGRSGTRFVTPL